jgi:hypothetical protein
MSETELVRDAARCLSEVRGRTLLVLTAQLAPPTVRAVREVLPHHGRHLDLVLRSPGGCVCCAYVVARELHRRFERVEVFVPLATKSAATLIALAADELVLGDLGELGPLDAQSDNLGTDSRPDRSCLKLSEALALFKGYARDACEELARSLTENGIRSDDAYRTATEFAGKICQPLYGQLSPQALGESMRNNQVGVAYADRILRRYRPELYAQNGPKIIERLAWEYPTHSFVIDREELEEMGVPARAPTAAEALPLEELANALASLPDDTVFIEAIAAPMPAAETAGDANESNAQRPRALAA